MKSLRTLNKYVWRYKSLFFLGFVCVVISNLFAVYPPQVVRGAIDDASKLVEAWNNAGTPEGQSELAGQISWMLLKFALLVVALSLLRGLFMFFMRQTLVVMSRKIEFDLRNDLYGHLQNLTLSFYRRNKTGDLMARATEDIGRVRMYAGPAIMYMMNTVSMLIITVTTMFIVNPWLTLITLIPLPILSLVIYFVETLINKRSDQIQKQLSELNSYTQEVYSGIRLTKSYVREEDFSRAFRNESDRYMRRSMRLVKLNALFQPSVMFLVGLSTILTVWIGSEQVIAKQISIGNIAEFVIYVNLLVWPIIGFGWTTTLIQRAAASQARIDEILREKPEITFPETGEKVRQASLRFENVSFTYAHTGLTAINHVSFELKAGQKLGVIGPTGSGKSTFCNLIPRLLDPSDGTIYLDGRPLKSYTREELRESIGYCPQDVFLFSETIAENIAFGKPEATTAEIEDAARKAGILENIREFPEGFKTIVGERGVTLSGGQKQRAALARAWIRNPKLLLLDDCLSAVDTRTEEEILRNLKQARTDNPDMSVVMMSHRVSAIQDSDLILVIEEGKVTERGTHQELLDQGGYYANIHRKQLLEEQMAH